MRQFVLDSFSLEPHIQIFSRLDCEYSHCMNCLCTTITYSRYIHVTLYTYISSKFWEVEVEVEVNLRPTVSRPVRPGDRHSSGTRDELLPFSVWLFFRQLTMLWYKTDRRENGTSNNPPIVVCVFVAAVTLLGSRCLATCTTVKEEIRRYSSLNTALASAHIQMT
jgi:hypothetical protein